MKSFLLLLAVVFCSTVAANAAPNECVLPERVQTALGEKWREWRLLQLTDLRSDDQRLWREHRLNGSHCPGFNEGKFDGEHKAFVFTLVKQRRQVMMVAMPSADSYSVTLLVRPMQVPYFSVVNVFPPGKYSDFYTGRQMRIRNESAAMEAIESSIQLFYLRDGKWHSLVISD